MRSTDRYAARREEMARLSREQVAALDQQIEQAEAAIRDLKTERQEALRILHVMDPNSRPKRTGRPKGADPRRGPSSKPVSQKAIDDGEAFLRKHFANADFARKTLMDHKEWKSSDGGTTNLLAAMHELGIIRLDHVGPKGSKFYRLAAAGGTDTK